MVYLMKMRLTFSFFTIVPPLSLVMSGQELPEGESEPELMILDRGASDTDTRFLHIMVCYFISMLQIYL